MDRASTLEFISHYIQLGKDIVSIEEQRKKETKIYLQISDSVLSGHIDVGKAEKERYLAIQRLDNLKKTTDFLENAKDNLVEVMNSQNQKVIDLRKERSQIAHRIRSEKYIVIQSIEDVDMLLLLQEDIINWGA